MTMQDNQITFEQVTTFSPALSQRIRELAQMIGSNYKPLTDDDLKELLASHDTGLLVAKDIETEEIAGMITIFVKRTPYVRKATFEDIVIDEKFRGRGIGQQLLQHAITFAKEKEAHYIDVTSRPRRIASNSLYQKMGFQKRDTNVYRYIIDYAEV